MKICRNRKPFFVFGWICAITAAIAISGCHAPRVPLLPGEDSPVERIRISAITEFVPDVESPIRMQVKTLIELFDASDSSVKVPCAFRFELYEFHPLSSDPRGGRLMIWPEQKLNDSDTNDEHWNELLRGYEFVLPFDFLLNEDKKYVLEATCLVNQKRYHDLFKMQYRP